MNSIIVEVFTERNLDKVLSFLHNKYNDVELIINKINESRLIREILMMNTFDLTMTKEFISIYGTKVRWSTSEDIEENTFVIKYR